MCVCVCGFGLLLGPPLGPDAGGGVGGVGIMRDDYISYIQ